ncbi:MAG: 23S rRNA (uracil(1939)-C(5))-methyltransferase RlmD [Pseudomonadota bacterium]
MARRRLPSEPFEVQIEGLDAHAAGLTEHDGRPLRVWDALPDERVRARYLFGRRFRGQGQTLEVLAASPDRVFPPCAFYGTCSACSLQHMANDRQLDFKQARLLALLNREGGLVPEHVLPPLQASRWQYRRKARLSVRWVPRKERVLVGFRERDGRFVTDMDACQTLHPYVAEALPALSELLHGLDARATIPQLEASCGDESAALVVRHLEALSEADEQRLASFERTSGLRLYLQPKGPDTVQPLTPGPSRLNYRLDAEDLTYTFEPLDFVQVNAALNAAMVAQAMDLLQPQATDHVLDLFCGLGNFTLPLARRSASVLGLEGSSTLVGRAQANAQANGLANARFSAVDLYGALPPEAWPAQSVDLILLDPPRSGAGPLIANMAATGARAILYVSCNPETLASDASALVRDHGYRLDAAGAMDMFPQTAHIEAMALFVRA